MDTDRKPNIPTQSLPAARCCCCNKRGVNLWYPSCAVWKDVSQYPTHEGACVLDVCMHKSCSLTFIMLSTSPFRAASIAARSAFRFDFACLAVSSAGAAPPLPPPFPLPPPPLPLPEDSAAAALALPPLPDPPAAPAPLLPHMVRVVNQQNRPEGVYYMLSGERSRRCCILIEYYLRVV